jgi:DNA-binding XRE family transcriptional regulator
VSALAVAFDVRCAGTQPRHDRQDQVFDQVRGQYVAPFDRNNASEGRVEKFTKASGLPELLSAALKRRMTPTSGLTDIVLAHALGVSRQTVWTWLNGVNQPKGHHLMALLTFFDASFANEILEPTGCTVAKLCNRRAEALRKISEGMAALRELG